MGVFEIGFGAAFLLVVTVAVWRALTSDRSPRPLLPAGVEELRAAKRRFIAQMNRRIGQEPESALQLQTLRDMVVGWYDLEGPVAGACFVARACCEACYDLDGKHVSLLDVHQLVRMIPPLHRAALRNGECGCTLSPVTVARAARVETRAAVGKSRPLLG